MSNDLFRPTRFQILPPVVKNLLIINGIFYLATVVIQDKFGIDLAKYLGLHYVTSDLFRPHQLITYMFMHGGIWHILLNMFPIWMFGSVLESYWGSKRFLIYFLATGLGAAVVQLGFNWYELQTIQEHFAVFTNAVNPQDFKNIFSQYISIMDSSQINEFNVIYSKWQVDPNPMHFQEAIRYVLKVKSDIPTVGASGAVFGVLLAFGMMFPNTILYVYFAIPMKAKWVVLLYGLFELYSGVENNPADNVAHFAHLGGMLFGFILMRIWKKKQNRFDTF